MKHTFLDPFVPNNRMRILRRRRYDSETKQEKKRELECEEAIIAEKNRFTRVRKTFMDYMRAEYGHMADRVLSRINKRMSKGYFKTTLG